MLWETEKKQKQSFGGIAYTYGAERRKYYDKDYLFLKQGGIVKDQRRKPG